MKISLIGMIYKSVEYFTSMSQELKRTCTDSKYDVDYLIIANDPVVEVTKVLDDKCVVYNDPKPNDYYLNRVYRAWNYGGRLVSADVVVFVNSDMIFYDNWLDNLLEHLDDNTIPCCKLVESGKLIPGKHAVDKNFGTSIDSLDLDGFKNFAKSISHPGISTGGLFMPCAFYKKDFVLSGGYPEGNVYEKGVGINTSKFLESGDHYFFYKNSVMKNKDHITVNNSICYHIQEGEKDA